MRRGGIAAGIALALSFGAAPAHGGTVHATGPDCTVPGCESRIVFEDGAGEANRLETRSRADSNTVTLADPGAPLTAGVGCTQVDVNSARCDLPSAELRFIYLRMGPGDDYAQSYGDLATFLFGGPGDDQLLGSGNSDWLDGGPGVDLVDGGFGNDTANYAERAEPVSVDLEHGRATGPGGDVDTLRDIEFAVGGSGDDVIAGRVNDNQLRGGPGNDTIRGHDIGNDLLQGEEGDDRLFGLRGEDSLAGGPGADLLDGGSDLDHLNPGRLYLRYPVGRPLLDPKAFGDPESANVFACGDRPDYVLPAGPRDVLGADCDRAVVLGTGLAVVGLDLRMRSTRSAVGWIGGTLPGPGLFRISCHRAPCPRIDVTLSDGTLVGGRALRPRRRDYIRPEFALNERGRRLLRERRRLRLRVALTNREGRGSFLADAHISRPES